jgi:hypothetical protein
LLSLRAVFRLALRQTEGLIGSIFRLLGLDLPVWARGMDSVAYAWNNGSQLNESSARASNGHGFDREERLLCLVDILRTEQVSASIAAK